MNTDMKKNSPPDPHPRSSASIRGSAYELTEGEKRDLIQLIGQGKPLPEKYRFILFKDSPEVELIWNGETRKEQEFRELILKAYRAEPLPEAGFFHGKTGGRLVVVGPIHLPVGRLFVEEVIAEGRKGLKGPQGREGLYPEISWCREGLPQSGGREGPPGCADITAKQRVRLSKP